MDNQNRNINNDVEQIRELILGPKIKEFEKRFEELEISLKEQENRLAKQFSELFDKLRRETKRTFETIDQRIDDLADVSRKDRLKLKEMINNSDENLQTQIRTLKNDFKAKLKINIENLEDEDRKIRKQLEEFQDRLEKIIQREIGLLDKEKVSRESMATMLLDLAVKLQGSDINDMMTTSQEQDAEKGN